MLFQLLPAFYLDDGLVADEFGGIQERLGQLVVKVCAAAAGVIVLVGGVRFVCHIAYVAGCGRFIMWLGCRMDRINESGVSLRCTL